MYIATLASVITSTAVQHSGACQHDYGPSLEATEATEVNISSQDEELGSEPSFWQIGESNLPL